MLWASPAPSCLMGRVMSGSSSPPGPGKGLVCTVGTRKDRDINYGTWFSIPRRAKSKAMCLQGVIPPVGPRPQSHHHLRLSYLLHCTFYILATYMHTCTQICSQIHMHTCMCTCIYVCMNTNTHAHTYKFIHTCTNVLHVHTYRHTHLCIQIYSLHMHIHMHVCIYIYVHIYTHMYIHSRMYTHACMYTFTCTFIHHMHTDTHMPTCEYTHMILPSSLFDPSPLRGIFMISNKFRPRLISLSSHD